MEALHEGGMAFRAVSSGWTFKVYRHEIATRTNGPWLCVYTNLGVFLTRK